MAAAAKVVPQAANRCRQWAIFSNARFRVRGPNQLMVIITINMLLAMNANTPGVPRCSRIKPINKLLNTVDKRLNE